MDRRTWAALAHPRRLRPLLPHAEPGRVEVSLRHQWLVVYRGGRPVFITHVSTGSGRRYCVRGHCGIAITPRGDFRVERRFNGWHRSPLGELYRPLYFDGGVAIHGSINVPPYPASHGCVRLTLDHADEIYRVVRDQTPVYVR